MMVSLAQFLIVAAILFTLGWWGAVKRWWSCCWDTVNWLWCKCYWEGVLAISNCVVAISVWVLYLTYQAAKTQEEHSEAAAVIARAATDKALQAQQTYNYINLWNSPAMLRQRRILAGYLLPDFDENKIGLNKPAPQNCTHPEKLSLAYLKLLYPGPNPFPQLSANSAKFSAFEAVRTFFEQLGAAYREGGLNDDTAFQAFSFPAEAYWSMAVSGWLDEWLRLGKDPSVGTEFAYFECILESHEAQVRPIPPEDFLLVLDQDANLPDEGGGAHESASPQPHGEAIFGPRIPTEYFITKGAGESGEGIPPDPYETFSYDIALQKAGIENFNVVPYTSVLPPEAREVPLQEVKPTFHHGAVLEVIMAKMGGVRKQTVCAGIGRARALDSAGKLVGGYAAEYRYKYDHQVAVALGEQAAKTQLTRSLNHELSIRGFKQDGQEMKFDVECLRIRKKYGMALAAIGFVKFIYPEAKASAQ